MTARIATATDDQIREAIAAGKKTRHIMKEFRCGAKRINALRGDPPKPARRRPEPVEVEPIEEALQDELEGEGEGEGEGPLVSIHKDYLHALEAVVILTHLLAAAREG